MRESLKKAPAVIITALCVPVSSKTKASDLTALNALYDGTLGHLWTKKTYWKSTTEDPCINQESWYGVGCIDPCYTPIDGLDCTFGRISSVLLPNNNLAGTIADAAFDGLTNVTVLDLGHNELSGVIPTHIGKLRNAQRIDLSSNKLSGAVPTQIGTVGTKLGLTHLDLSYNKMSDAIPTHIGSLTNLKALDLSYNVLLGGAAQLPTEMGALTKLEYLMLDAFNSGGTIPTQFGNLGKLRYFRALGTTAGAISGTLPTEIGKLRNLNEFMISSNEISGAIPTEIGEMTILRKFRAESNKLSGKIPNVFGALHHLTYWDTYDNKLTGDVPDSISNVTTMQHLYLQLEHSDPVRTWHCRQRIPAAGKYNWRVYAQEYWNYINTKCATKHSVAFTFNALSGDI